jgi:hypothetical protein
MRAVKFIALSITGWLLSMTGTMADEPSVALQVLWSMPTAISRAAIPQNDGAEPGLVFNAQAMYPDGRIIFLGSRTIAGKRVAALFAGPEHNPSDNAIDLALKDAHRGDALSLLSAPYPVALAVGGSGEIWVAGRTNWHLDIASGHHSDAYLAKIDARGRAVWEKTYGDGGERQILSVASLPAGEIAVAGEDSGKGWLARIGADGSPLWERRLDNAKGSVIASLPANRLVVAAFESTGSARSKDYQDNVTAWIVDGSGEVLAKTRIRNAINTSSMGYFGRIGVAANDNAIYVVSNWTGSPRAQPVEVSRLELDGRLVWSRSLPSTVVAMKGTENSCFPALAVNPRGDVLIACALRGQVQLYQLEQSSGSFRESDLSLPGCDYAKSFLAVRKDGTMILSGSRPAYTVTTSCAWTGRLTEVH